MLANGVIYLVPDIRYPVSITKCYFNGQENQSSNLKAKKIQFRHGGLSIHTGKVYV